MNETVTLGWLYLPAAFVLGALHALEPGHGKSLASAYLVSGRHTWKDAVVLGLATTFSHTAVIILLAVAGMVLKGFVDQSQLEHGIRVFGAWTLVALGIWTSWRALHDIRHEHEHGHQHNHGHGHASQGADQGRGYWGVALIGLGNGLLPCPGALAALLAALSTGQVALGLITVLTYSLGLATALAAMGILVVEAGRKARSWIPSDQMLLWIPVFSGLLVFGTGVWLLTQ